MSTSMIESITVGWLETNCYLVIDKSTKESIVIDPGSDATAIINAINRLEIKILAIINTHGHGDHIAANSDINQVFHCPIWIHRDDADMLNNPVKNLSSQFGLSVNSISADRQLMDNEIIEFGRSRMRVIHSPGHSPGSICLLGDEWLISGDTLFYQSIGRTDLLGGNYQMIIESIKQKLFILDDKLTVYPGHGPFTTIEEEKINNLYVGPGVKNEHN